MTKEEIEERLGCPIEKLPLEDSLSGTIAAEYGDCKGTFSVNRVVVEVGERPRIEFYIFLQEGRWRFKEGFCYTDDYGLTWAASDEDWEFARKYREERK